MRGSSQWRNLQLDPNLQYPDPQYILHLLPCALLSGFASNRCLEATVGWLLGAVSGFTVDFGWLHGGGDGPAGLKTSIFVFFSNSFFISSISDLHVLQKPLQAARLLKKACS